MEFALIGIALFLAFGNGANDNFKGFATVWGTETLDYRRALLFATLATVAGSLVSWWLAALLLAGQALDATTAALAIAIAMAAGGLLHARRVAVTMSRRLTRMDHGQGLAANLITAALVLFASKLGLPVSTTHVSVGSIAGIGAGAGTVDRATMRNIALSWIATLPLATVLAWLTTLAIGAS